MCRSLVFRILQEFVYLLLGLLGLLGVEGQQFHLLAFLFAVKRNVAKGLEPLVLTRLDIEPRLHRLSASIFGEHFLSDDVQVS